MSGTVYSYKPASGVLTEGASTVVTLKTGELLELRRGQKTYWAADEPRHRWATLEEWKATLPADAEIKVRAAAAAVSGSADFERVRAMLVEHKCRPYMRMWARTNATDASEYRRCADEIHRDVEWIVCRNNGDVAIMNRWERDWLSKQYAKAADYRVRASEALAKEPYTRYVSQGYKSLGTCRLLARRTSDGMFIPLFLDLGRGLFHTPVTFSKVESRVGATLAEMGVDPVFLLHSSTAPGALQQVTL